MKRILVTIVGQGSIIYIIRSGLLDEMKKYCQPVVALLWDQEDLIEELRSKCFEVHVIPPYKITSNYRSMRERINFWYKNYLLRTPSTEIEKKLQDQYKSSKVVLKKKIKENILHSRFLFDRSYIQKLMDAENVSWKEQPCYNTYKQWLHKTRVDGLFTITPFLQEIELIARILQAGKKKVLTAIHSFDNITKRGWPAIIFDHYIVWNKYNKAELGRINESLLEEDRITIAGAPQFDFHYNPSYCLQKDEWLEKMHIPPDKRIILYAGGSEHLFPDEPQYLKHLAEGLERGFISNNTVILFRCHPLDKVERWKKIVGESKYIFYDSKSTVNSKCDYNNVTADEIIKLISTLKHADVHVNICSTMTVDGSVFKKPIIGPYYDEFRKENEKAFRDIYYQEHYKPIMQTNVVQLAYSKTELARLTDDALNNPVPFTKNSDSCVEEIITYNDGKSVKRVTDILEKFFS